MSSDDDPQPSPADESTGQATPPVLSYASPAVHGKLVTLRRFRQMEAELARAKLESEGIRCLLLDQNLSVAHPLLFNEVPLQVLEEDAERAKEILNRPVADDAEGEYVDEDWRCPRCHRRSVDLLPLPPGWRRVRMINRALWITPVVLLVLRWTLEFTKCREWIDQLFAWAALPWILITPILTVLVWTAKRDKRCRDCGFTWRKDGTPVAGG
jgi:hypothetical protein